MVLHGFVFLKKQTGKDKSISSYRDAYTHPHVPACTMCEHMHSHSLPDTYTCSHIVNLIYKQYAICGEIHIYTQQSHFHTHKHTHTHAYTYTLTHSHSNTHRQTHTHAYTHTHTNTDTHTQTHTHTHRHTH